MIITLDEYKAIAGVSGSGHDPQIQALIPVVEDDFLRIRGKAFDVADGGIAYPPGSKMAAAEMISYKLLTLQGGVGAASETIGDYTISRSEDLLHGYPRSTVQKIERFARAR